MTSLHLLLWIVGAILLQLSIYLSIGFWRHWQTYDALRISVAQGGLPALANSEPVSSETATTTWSGSARGSRWSMRSRSF